MMVSKSDLTGKGRQKKVVMARELIVHTAPQPDEQELPGDRLCDRTPEPLDGDHGCQAVQGACERATTYCRRMPA